MCLTHKSAIYFLLLFLSAIYYIFHSFSICCFIMAINFSSRAIEHRTIYALYLHHVHNYESHIGTFSNGNLRRTISSCHVLNILNGIGIKNVDGQGHP